MNSKIIVSLLFTLLYLCSFAQEKEKPFQSKYLTVGSGLFSAFGKEEEGLGIPLSIGYQWSNSEKPGTRYNLSLTRGSYTPILFLGSREQYFRLSTFEGIIHYDLLRYKSFSLTTSPGIFVGYSVGLLGTGASRNSDEFLHFYFGGRLSAGLRYAPPKKRVAYELRGINVYVGRQSFTSSGILFVVDIRLNKEKE